MTRARFTSAEFDIRFLSIWIALALLLAYCALFVPRSVQLSAMLAIVPLAAFLALATLGQAMVMMVRGIDLSTPAIVTLASTMLLSVSGGEDAGLAAGIAAALVAATLAGLLNGVLIAVLRLNALIVTLATGSIIAGATLWYREGMAQESTVPELLSDWSSSRVLGVNVAVWAALAVIVAATIVLRKTVVGRTFQAVGANPRAAYIAGISVRLYEAAAYTLAGLLYGAMAVMLSGFIRNPTLNVGAAYLLAPIAAAVLAGTAMAGGIASAVAVGGASLFLIQLNQMLKIMGLPTAYQFIIYGIAIALGMALSRLRTGPWALLRGGTASA